ncbi:MAG TPA: RraA family protein [Puia sp.]|nr:RraA family protein [Puia sp.]
MKSKIEKYEHAGPGYDPFLIRAGWQVAQLNHLDEQDLAGIAKIDMHRLTDEVFILLRGSAVLIAAHPSGAPGENGKLDSSGAPGENGKLDYECILMRPGITYNIPAGTWHNIAMDKTASVIIVERNDTHLGDFVFRQLSPAEKEDLRQKIMRAVESNGTSLENYKSIDNSKKMIETSTHKNLQRPSWNDDEELFSLYRSELYTPVVGDILDELGCYHQFLPQPIQPVRIEDKLIGRAMPVLMIDVYGPQQTPFGKLTEALDQLEKNEIYIATGGEMRCAYWGEILTATARIRGASGAVINGYYRDTPRVLEQNWPVFSRGRYAQDSGVRTQVVDYRCRIEIGGVTIMPGDLVFGDMDGVVIVPRQHEVAVTVRALEKARGEKLVRKEIENGMSSTAAFKKYGIL